VGGALNNDILTGNCGIGLLLLNEPYQYSGRDSWDNRMCATVVSCFDLSYSSAKKTSSPVHSINSRTLRAVVLCAA